jgi:hypothetical protein
MVGRWRNILKEKHLEFIQNVITRMNSNSFLIKGWALTIFSAITAFASKDTNSTMVWINFVPILAFWGLDAFYLRQERLFRKLYENVIKEDSKIPEYSMNTKNYQKAVDCWLEVCFSRTIFPFYGALFVSNIVAVLILFKTGIMSFICENVCH